MQNKNRNDRKEGLLKKGSKFFINENTRNLKRHRARQLDKSDLEWLRRNP